MSTSAKQIIDEYHSNQTERSELDQIWEEVAEVISPERIGFSQGRQARRTQKIYDTQPLVAKRGLVNAINAMLRPKTSSSGKWFDIMPEEEKLAKGQAAKEWIADSEDRLWKALYNPKANFIQSTGEVDDDIVSFGSGAGFVDKRSDGSGLLFRSFHMKGVYYIINGDGSLEGALIAESITAKEAADRWGEENLGKKTQEAFKGSEKQKKKRFIFIESIRPRHDRNPSIITNTNMPFEDIVVDVDSEKIVLESGFIDQPLFLPRWDTRSGEVYGRGVGVLALPDVQTLNQMGKTMLRGLHRAVAPSWLLPSDSMVNAPDLRPDGVSYYDAAAIKKLGLQKPFQQMTSAANIPWGLDAQKNLREAIQALFFRNVLNLPIDTPQMTATEVIQRREEFIREIGSVFGRMESDYTGPIIERSFNLMMRNGGFAPPPEELQGKKVNFRFASPVEKATKQIEAATLMESINRVLEIEKAGHPEAAMRIDWDEVGKFIAESGDLPPQLVLDDNQVEALMAKVEKEAEIERDMQTAERIVQGAAQLPMAA
jgi:hypothetical protein